MSPDPDVPDELAARRRVDEGTTAPPDRSTGEAAVAPPGRGTKPVDDVIAAEHRVELSEVLVDFAQDLLVDFNVDLVLRNLCERLPAVLPIDGAGVSLLEQDELRFAQATSEDLAVAERA